MKRALWFRMFGALLLLATALASWAKVEITVDAKNGDTIFGDRTFRVLVTSENLVTQVEFYVGEELRETDSSTPYEFRIDTLAEREGPFEVSFAAYTSEGEQAKVKLNLTIDNQLQKGADHFVERGREALVEGQWDEALRLGRTALKVQPGHNPARMVMARANFGKGVMDAAQKFVEEVLTSEPQNLDALELGAGINLNKGFAVFNRGGADRQATLDAIRALLVRAAAMYSQSGAARVASFGTISDANRMAYVDTALRASRYSLAIAELEQVFARDTRDTAVANRLAYAQIRAARLTAARRTMTEHTRRNQPDAFGWALSAYLAEQAGDRDQSLEAERQALVNDGSDLGVRTMQAFLAILRGRTQAFAQIATDLARDEGARPVVQYYMSSLYDTLGQFTESRTAFERAVLGDPALHDLYVQRANQAIAFSYRAGLDAQEAEYQRKLARVMFDAALAGRPESFEAHTGAAILALMDGRQEDALRSARAAVAAGPEYAPGHYVLAAVLSNASAQAQRDQSRAEIARDQARAAVQTDEVARFEEAAREARERGIRLLNEVTQALANAGRFDRPNLEGRSTPAPIDAWRHFVRFGRLPLLALPQ